MYVSSTFCPRSVRKLEDLRHRLGLTEHKGPEGGFHTTIMYSLEEFHLPAPKTSLEGVSIDPATFEYALFGVDESILVLRFTSPELVKRNAEAQQAGAVNAIFGYSPHVTLAYDVAGIDLSTLRVPGFRLFLEAETVCPV